MEETQNKAHVLLSRDLSFVKPNGIGKVNS